MMWELKRIDEEPSSQIEKEGEKGGIEGTLKWLRFQEGKTRGH